MLQLQNLAPVCILLKMTPEVEYSALLTVFSNIYYPILDIGW